MAKQQRTLTLDSKLLSWVTENAKTGNVNFSHFISTVLVQHFNLPTDWATGNRRRTVKTVGDTAVTTTGVTVNDNEGN